VGIAFGTTSGRFASPTTIAAFVPARGAPVLAGNARGQLAVAYVQSLTGGRRSVTLVERPAGGRFGRPGIVAGRGQANAATVAVGPGGGLVVAWERDGQVFARVRPAGGRLGPIVTLGPAVRGQTTVRAAIGSGGAVWVAWSSQLLTEGGDNGPFEVRVAVRAARRAAFGRAVRLDSYARRASIEDVGVQLGLDSAGAGYLAWTGFDGANFRARLAALDVAGGSPRVTTLSGAGYDAVVGAVATGPRPGVALGVWSRLDPVGELGTQILAGLVTPAGYAGEETVSDADRARLPAAAFDPVGGEPTVAWTQRVGPDGPGVPIGQIRTVVRVATREAG
jgi:hypothetical protein